MAQKVTTFLIDDIDGEPADETVTFGLDSSEFEIDLTKDHALELRDGLATYVKHGRRVGGRKTRNSQS